MASQLLSKPILHLYEIASWTASDALLQDRSIMDQPLQLLATFDGCLGGHFGMAEEDEKQVFILVPWKTVGHHKDLPQHKNYPAFGRGVKKTIGNGPYSMWHIPFNKDPTAALTAPTTEILKITIREGAKREEVIPLLKQITDGVAAVDGAYSPAWGVSIEDPNILFVVVGWESKEIHSKRVTGPAFMKPIGELAKRAKLEMKHSKLMAPTLQAPSRL